MAIFASAAAGLVFGMFLYVINRPTKQLMQGYFKWIAFFTGESSTKEYLPLSTFPNQRHYFAQELFYEMVVRVVLGSGLIFGLGGIIGNGYVFGMRIASDISPVALIGMIVLGLFWGVVTLAITVWYDAIMVYGRGCTCFLAAFNIFSYFGVASELSRATHSVFPVGAVVGRLSISAIMGKLEPNTQRIWEDRIAWGSIFLLPILAYVTGNR